MGDASFEGPTTTAPVKSEAETTRERILDVAEALFAERGLAGTAMRDLAREAGLTAPSLYNHFEGKQALYDAVLVRGIEPFLRMVSEYGTQEASMQSSLELIDAVMDQFANRPNMAKLIQHESLTGGASLGKMVDQWLRPIVDEGVSVSRRNPGTFWAEEERPLAIAAWIHMMLGHFAMAPLLQQLFDFDPLAPEGIERQKRFLRRLGQFMVSGPESDK